MSKTKECFAYNTKIIETPTTKEVYIYENPIFIHSKEKQINRHKYRKNLMKCQLISNMTV